MRPGPSSHDPLWAWLIISGSAIWEQPEVQPRWTLKLCCGAGAQNVAGPCTWIFQGKASLRIPALTTLQRMYVLAQQQSWMGRACPPFGPVFSSWFIHRLSLMIQTHIHSANHASYFCNLGLRISALGCWICDQPQISHSLKPRERKCQHRKPSQKAEIPKALKSGLQSSDLGTSHHDASWPIRAWEEELLICKTPRGEGGGTAINR